MSTPPPDHPVPGRVAELATGRDLIPVWVNALGGVTFRTGGPTVTGSAAPELHIKYGPLNPESSMADEVARMTWLLPRLQGTGLTVPRVVEHGRDSTHEWLVTETLPYASVVSETWLRRPEIAIPAGARALRALHDAVDPATCPFDWSVGARVAAARAAGAEVPDHLRRSPAVEPVVDAPMVVAHGDACLPNTLLDERGQPRALVDLALLGVADVWADLAAAVWSVDFNFGPGWRETYLEAYGIELDQDALDFHLELRNYA